MKKYKVLSIAMVIVLLLGSTLPVNATTHKLNITARAQEQTWWCWAAVAQMIIDYLDTWIPLPTQTDIVTTLKGSAVNEGALPNEITSVLGWYMVSTTYTNSTISFSSVKNMLSGWYSPIAAGIAWSEGGAHMQMIYGYEENGVYQGLYVVDPLTSGTQRYYYNFEDYIRNSEFYWCHTWYNNKKKS